MHISLSLTPHQTGVCLFEDAALGGSGAGWETDCPFSGAWIPHLMSHKPLQALPTPS
jgi:hypothetical protein